MRPKFIGLTIGLFLVTLFVYFGESWAAVPSQLVVVTGMDGSIYKMNCWGGNCPYGWVKITGAFKAQPTLTWDPILGNYFLYGVGLDNRIWRSTFDIMGNHNNDWMMLPGGTYYPVAAAGGPTIIAWARVNANGTIWDCFNCNRDPSLTRKVFTGGYAVKFTVGNISVDPRSVVIDGGDFYDLTPPLGMASASPWEGDISAIFVNTMNQSGVLEDRPFFLVIYNN